MNDDFGNDPDGDLDGYDGPIGCTCGPWAQGGRDINCPIHADQNRQVLGYTDEVIEAAHLLGRRGIDGAMYEKLISANRATSTS